MGAAAGPSRSEHWRRSPKPLARSAKATSSPEPLCERRTGPAEPPPAHAPKNLSLWSLSPIIKNKREWPLLCKCVGPTPAGLAWLREDGGESVDDLLFVDRTFLGLVPLGPPMLSHGCPFAGSDLAVVIRIGRFRHGLSDEHTRTKTTRATTRATIWTSTRTPRTPRTTTAFWTPGTSTTSTTSTTTGATGATGHTEFHPG